MRRPSVLFLNRVYPPSRGATGRVLQDLARSFEEEGWHVTVIASGSKKEEERDGTIKIYRVKAREKPESLFSYFWVWFKILLRAITIRGRYLVVTMSDPPLIVVAGKIVASLKRSRHINWCQDIYPDVMPALGLKIPVIAIRFFMFLSRLAMNSCDKIIVPGRCMARHLASNGVDPRKITMIPNWPDFVLLQPKIEEHHYEDSKDRTLPPESRPYNELLKEPQKFRVLYAGNIGLAHPVQTILDAAEMLEDEFADIEFVFVGDGKQFDHIATQRSARGLSNIRLLPFQPEERLRELMESGDLHLISMKEETAGLLVPCKLYSALAVGRPCILIGPAQSETAKVIQDFNAGTIIAQGDAVRLAEAIKNFRLNGEDWFVAHDGALQAGDVFTPAGSIKAWMKRAWDVVQNDLKTPC